MADDAARWRRLESVVHAALARPAEERAAFLAKACAGDSDLLRDAASLLEREGRADEFLGTPLDAVAARAIAGPALTAGQTLAHYRIVQAIGAGGMGQVYAAEDTRLDRQVALKILPPDLADDADRRVRFTREAKAIAALNHPNIVTVYAVEEADGRHFITMELVRGRTLAELLPRNGFALGRFLEMAIPLTDALAAAHQQGITHRDVKPTNVMVTDDGRVKVLDFGLAKAQPEGWQHDGTRALRSATEEGHIVGTPAYMSPEQAEGKTVDARSDIFSLGIVCYELLTGQRPFGGDSATAMLSSILSHTPRPLSEVKPDIPRRLARLVHRCLEKNPVNRYQSAVDLRHDLEEIQRDEESGDAVPSPPSRSGRLRGMTIAWGLVAAIVVAGAASLWLSGTRLGLGGEAVPRLQNPVQVTTSLSVESYPTWSPDGQRLAYQSNDVSFYLLGNHDIWVAQLGSGEPVNLTQGGLANDRRPSWSPDGREIAFFSDRDGDWGVYTVPAIGGNARKLLPLPASTIAISSHAPQWSQNGTRLFVLEGENNRNFVITVSLESLQTTRVALPQHESPRVWDLSVRPDDGRFAYLEAGGGNPEVTRLWTIDASGAEAIPLTDGRTNVWSPTWSADGRTIFYVSNRGGRMDLWQQRVADDGNPLGEPVFITQGVGMTSAVFSPNGAKLAYGSGGRVSNVWRVPILTDRAATWADATRVTSEHAYIEFVDVSPDGQQLAVSSDRRGNQDLWVLPSGGGEMTPLTTDLTPDWNPRWSPDGSEILFYAYRSGNRDIWIMPSGGGPARQLTSRAGFDWFPSWSPDGREIAFQVSRTEATEIWIMDASGNEPRFLTQGASPSWSPDGQWIVGTRQRSLFRVAKNGGEPLRIPTLHAPNTPQFSRDGQSIYYSVIDGPREHHGHWRLSLKDGTVARLTELEGRRGRMGYIFSADARFLYFTWYEDDGDIWVMDVASNGGR